MSAPVPKQNPFATPASAPARKPPFQARPDPARGSWWTRLRAWIGWPAPSASRRRLFQSSDQLELVLGRSSVPARNRDLEVGLPARVRRSDTTVGQSKVIYESKPTAAIDAARMREESDRAYTRLRGRRLDSLKVGTD